jgi:hypothetical protein
LKEIASWNEKGNWEVEQISTVGPQNVVIILAEVHGC